MLASPTLAEERDCVAALTLPQEAQGFRHILVDTGAGSHLLQKGLIVRLKQWVAPREPGWSQ